MTTTETKPTHVLGQRASGRQPSVKDTQDALNVKLDGREWAALKQRAAEDTVSANSLIKQRVREGLKLIERGAVLPTLSAPLEPLTKAVWLSPERGKAVRHVGAEYRLTVVDTMRALVVLADRASADPCLSVPVAA